MTPDNECVYCESNVESVVLDGGGRIGWFCVSCSTFYPDEGVRMRAVNPEEYRP